MNHLHFTLLFVFTSSCYIIFQFFAISFYFYGANVNVNVFHKSLVLSNLCHVLCPCCIIASLPCRGLNWIVIMARLLKSKRTIESLLVFDYWKKSTLIESLQLILRVNCEL